MKKYDQNWAVYAVHFCVQGLQPGTVYSVRVLAHNEHGPGSSSPPIVIRTQAEVDLPAPPSALSATPISAFSILVSWLPPANPEGVEKYKLYYRRVKNRKIKFYICFRFSKLKITLALVLQLLPPPP